MYLCLLEVGGFYSLWWIFVVNITFFVTVAILNQKLNQCGSAAHYPKTRFKKSTQYRGKPYINFINIFFQFLTLLVITDNFKVKSMRTAVLDTGKLETGNIKNKFPTE